MDIVGEISQSTVSLPAGDSVSSIFVLQISLKKKDFDEKSITLISKLIEQKMIFVLEFESKAKLAVYYGKLFQTDWQDVNDISIDIQGLNLDSAYQNMIMQIGDIYIENDNSLDEQMMYILVHHQKSINHNSNPLVITFSFLYNFLFFV